MCLASIVYQLHLETKTGFFHNDFAGADGTQKTTVPADHHIRGNLLFKDRSLLDPLLQLVRCDYVDRRVPEGITSTGIPPSVTTLRYHMIHANDMAILKDQLHNLPEKLGKALEERLDKFAQDQGNITQSSLRSMFQKELGSIKALLQGRRAERAEGIIAGESEINTEVKDGLFLWTDGSASLLPENFVFQQGSIRDALTIWYKADTVSRRGEDQMTIPPLRIVSRKDFKSKSHKARFSQVLKPLIRHLEALLRKDHPDLIQPAVWNKQKYQALIDAQFNDLWEKTKAYFPKITAKGYKKSRPTEVSMAYALKLLRQKAKAESVYSSE